MKVLFSTWVLLALLCAPVVAQPSMSNTNTLAIGKIQAIPSLAKKITAAGKTSSMDQVLEAMDSQLIDRVNATRKFKIMASTDLKEIVKGQELQNSGNYNLNDPNTAKQFQLGGIRWLLVTTLDDFEDQTQRRAGAQNTMAIVRKMRLTASCRIFDATTGALLESASHTLTNNTYREALREAADDAEATDSLLLPLVRNMAEWVAVRVADTAFPIRVLAKTDTLVTVNRGEGTGIAVDQVYTVNVLGAELKDPDTGESLGREELAMGKVRITEVTPKFSKGELLEDFGVRVGSILRPVTDRQKAAQSQPPPPQ